MTLALEREKYQFPNCDCARANVNSRGRRSLAVTLLEANVNLATVRVALGHKDQCQHSGPTLQERIITALNSERKTAW
jgi:hypothetical protein